MSRAAIHALARRPGSLNEKVFRDACTHFASGVTIATVQAPDGSLHGLTVSSFTSVSMEPPLILICIGHGCPFLSYFRSSTHFGVNVLEESQRDLSVTFAEKEEGRFEGVDWHPGTTGVPLLAGCVATFECQVMSILEAGDHAIFLAEVLHAASHGGRPLLYYHRQYGALR